MYTQPLKRNLYFYIMTKKELRIKYKALQQSLTESEVDEMSITIANHLVKMNIWNHQFYHVFLSIEENKEVNTDYLLHILAGKDKEVVVSKSNFLTLAMTHYLLTDGTRLKKNQYNIPEPIDGLEVPVSKIDVVFVPLIAFDKGGNRVGYGKGFYDKFLGECRADTLKIGLSFFEAEEQITDLYQGDVTLDFCITPKGVYKF